MVQVTMKIHLAVPFTLLGYRNSDITRYLTLLSDCVYDVLKFTLSCCQVQLWIEMPGGVLNEVLCREASTRSLWRISRSTSNISYGLVSFK